MGYSDRSSLTKRRSRTSISIRRQCYLTGTSSSSGQIKDDFANPAIGQGSGRKGRVVLTNGAPAPLKLSARRSARVRLRLGNATTAHLTTVATSGAKPFIVAVDGQPSEPFEPLTASSRWVQAPGLN